MPATLSLPRHYPSSDAYRYAQVRHLLPQGEKGSIIFAARHPGRHAISLRRARPDGIHYVAQLVEREAILAIEDTNPPTQDFALQSSQFSKYVTIFLPAFHS